ncbi:MAG: sigma-54-dependent Fis family transcriptional regulator [Acidobacteria bacterium]|nr:sigma-54-dependent Fis family transcriptional regulator [Acidobacteriota bacterium]
MRPKASVLIAEDESQARESLRALLEDEGYQVLCAPDGMEASRILNQSSVEAAVIDIRMPFKDGLALLRELKDHPAPPAVLIMTAYGTSAVAIEAMALGAFDYLTKPLNFDELRIQLQRAIEDRRRTSELEAYRIEEDAQQESEIVGSSPAMQKLYKMIGQVSSTDSTVLIRGESGTGKEVVARAIHKHSLRASRRLVKVNCASIPETLLEAELFGHERGAFTGASQRRIGKFEYAAGGTLFLDEIGELGHATQVKLLRVLQDHCIERLGSNITIPLDVRILAATNCDLESAVKEGRFREDLYYRLNVVTLRIPPLRQRHEDIMELAQFLLRRSANRMKLQIPSISEEAKELLCNSDWPGNVRELEHCLERALILSRSGVILREHVELSAVPSASDPMDSFSLEDGLRSAVAKLERRLIEKALASSGGNRTRASEILKINRRLLYDKLREYGME